MNPRRRSPGSARSAHARAFARTGSSPARALAGARLSRDGDCGLRPPGADPGDPGQVAGAAAAESHTTSITLHATRGVILDRDGRVLVSNVQVFDVFADPALIAAIRPCAGRRHACTDPAGEPGAGPACAEPAKPVRLPQERRFPGCERQAPGARVERHRHHPVGGERLRPVASPRQLVRREPARLRQQRTGSASTGWRAITTPSFLAVNGHEFDAHRRQRQCDRPRPTAEGSRQEWR